MKWLKVSVVSEVNVGTLAQSWHTWGGGYMFTLVSEANVIHSKLKIMYVVKKAKGVKKVVVKKNVSFDDY